MELNTAITGVLLNFSHNQLWELTILAFRATKNMKTFYILSAVYQQSGRRHASRQLSELRTVAFRAT